MSANVKSPDCLGLTEATVPSRNQGCRMQRWTSEPRGKYSTLQHSVLPKLRHRTGPGSTCQRPRSSYPPVSSLRVFIASVCLSEDDAEAFSASPFQPLEVSRMLVIMCNFSWSFHCTGILRQSVPVSNACGISQVPLSATKKYCMGGRVVSLYSH